MKIKTYDEIIAGIEFAMATSPKYRLQYIELLDEKIAAIDRDLEAEGIIVEKKDIDILEIAKQKGIKYLVFDKNGRLIQFWCKGKARDFQNGTKRT